MVVLAVKSAGEPMLARFSRLIPMYQGIGLRGRAQWAGHVGWDRLTPRKRGPLLFIRKAAEQLFEVGA